MPKLNEIEFLDKFYDQMGKDAGMRFALDKPFSHENCSRYLVDLGRVMCLLPEPPARVLDLGIGPGWTSVFLAKRGYHVVGQDICPGAIELAEKFRDRYEADSATFVVQDYESMPFEKEFDAALFYDALHHAEDERAALAAVYRALKPGGVCVTVEPGMGHSNSAPTLEAIATYGVTEKDMPPSHVIALGRDIGYTSFRVYERDMEPAPKLVTDLDRPVPASPPLPPLGRLRVAVRFARKAFRAALYGTCREDYDLFPGMAEPDAAPAPDLRQGNIVWMQK